MFPRLAGFLGSIFHLARVLVDVTTFCNLIEQEPSTALEQPRAQLVGGFGQKVDKTNSLFHKALPVWILHYHTWVKPRETEGQNGGIGLGEESINAFDFLLTISDGLSEAAEELVVLGQSEGSAPGLLKEICGCKNVGRVKHAAESKY